MQPHFDGLDTAFLQLAYALKLWHYLLEHPLPREQFDIALTIQEDSGSLYVMSHDQFKTDDDVTLASGNNIAICFGATAITLWEAIREHSGLESQALQPVSSDEHRVAALAYAIRCCFAHGTTLPRWELTPKYQIEYRLGGRRIDLRSRNGTAFTYDDIGGIDCLKLIRSHATRLKLL